MRVDIITVGDELLIGQTVNTNASWMGEALGLRGLDVRRVITVGDEASEMSSAIKTAVLVADLTIVTGGLGPTHDDITRNVIAESFNTKLVFDETIFATVKERFGRRGRNVPDSNRTQAMIPLGFDVLPNPIGTAPGFMKMVGTPTEPRYLAVVPGVPREMRKMITDQVLPRFQHSADIPTIRHRRIHTAGIGESHLQDKLDGVTSQLGTHVTLAYLPSLEGVMLRLSARAQDPLFVDSELDRVTRFIVDRAGECTYSVTGESLEAALGRLLVQSGDTVGVAESCTGGRVLDRLTNVSGSSAYVLGGVVAYCNRVKESLLSVSPEALAAHGAVSEIVAVEMAHGVREKLGSSIGLASTGILGPTGGSVDKPVGTVWIAVDGPSGSRGQLLKLGTDRESNKRRAVGAVLNLLRLDLAKRGYRDLS